MEDVICEIKFRKMKLSDDENSVVIEGDVLLRVATCKLSILQMAKIFGTDREMAKQVESNFGSEEYERGCNETRKFVKKFPLISTWNNKVEFTDISVGNPKIGKGDRNTVGILGEQMAGWNNEGLMIDFPADVYHERLAGKKFRILMGPFSVEFRK